MTGRTFAESPPAARQLLPLLSAALLAVTVSAGCSAFRPIDGIPATALDEAYRLPVRSGKETINLSVLSQATPAEYRLDFGDVLGIYIDGVLGADVDAPPVAGPQGSGLEPSLGYPIQVERDGTITLPHSGPVLVRGRSLAEVREMLRRLFTETYPILRADPQLPARVLVTLQRPRTYRVAVIRQETSRDTGLDQILQTGDVLRRGLGQVVELPAYQNDVLHALTATGGLPGLDAENAVYIIRHQFPDGGPEGYCPPAAAPGYGGPGFGGHTPPPAAPPGFGPQGGSMPGMPAGTLHSPQVLRIPLKVYPGEPLPFGSADVLLQTGDIVYIESRVGDFFYTSGLLGGGQYQLPRDYDLDVLGAMSIVQAQQRNFNGPSKNVGGRSVLNKDVTVGASKLVILRPTPDGGMLPIEVDLYAAVSNPRERVLLRPGDHLVLQYTRKEACAAFFERHFAEGLVLGIASSLFFSR